MQAQITQTDPHKGTENMSRVGTWKGVPIYFGDSVVSWTMNALLFSYLVWHDSHAMALPAPWPLAVLAGAIAAITASIAIHELAHLETAIRCGKRVEYLTVQGVTGGGCYSKDAFGFQDPSAEWKIALAGPVASFILGVVGIAASGAVHALHGNEGVVYACSQFGFMNLALAAFNMLPLLPFDGGRVLRGLLAVKYGQRAAMELMPIQVWHETEVTRLRTIDRLGQTKASDYAERNPILSSTTPIKDAAKAHRQDLYAGICLLIEKDGKIVGTVDLESVTSADRDAAVETIMTPIHAAIDANASAKDAYDLLTIEGHACLVVHDAAGEVLGTIQGNENMETLALFNAIEQGEPPAATWRSILRRARGREAKSPDAASTNA